MTASQPRPIAIVGAGVIGLTTALCLLEHGYRVTIYTRERTPRTTSDVAAAFWLPFKVENSPRVAVWAAQTRTWYEKLTRREGSGLHLTELALRTSDEPAEFLKDARSIPCDRGDRWRALTVPRIETPRFMHWLERDVLTRGAIIVDADIARLDAVPPAAALVINCTGLGAVKLARDATMFPIQGQIVRVARLPGSAERIVVDETSGAPTYIVPRAHDCILGGTAVENDWRTTPEPEVTTSIMARCSSFLPVLRSAEVLSVQVGLRPGRRAVRLEEEVLASGRRVVHNYGHGGAGFTLAWGCALAVRDLVRAQLSPS